MVTEYAYAKINLTLDVGQRRSDGYHSLQSLMCPIDIYDTLTFEEADSGILLLDNTTINVEDNFVFKAAKLFFEKKLINKGVIITLVKRIPSEAGLGGGSSDAAACLRGLNKLFQTGLSLEELASMAQELGSDMPFCVYQTLAEISGRGENVNVLNIPYQRFDILVIKPPFGLSTRLVYEEYKEQNSRRDFKKLQNVKDGLLNGDIELLGNNIFNDLEEPSFRLQPRLKEIKNELSKLGYYALMSGSGTAIFVLSKDGNFEDLVEKYGKYFTLFKTRLM